jgi:6-phosphogluconolactonase
LGGDLPTYVTELPTGDWPRHISVSGNKFYVANERADHMTFMRIDLSTGIPYIVSRLGIPSPTCVLTR